MEARGQAVTITTPSTSKNLLRQRHVDGERIETKAGWNPDVFLYANGVLSFRPGLCGTRYTGFSSQHAFQPQRGCVP